MEIATSILDAAHRLGVTIEGTLVERKGVTVELATELIELMAPDATGHDHRTATWALVGIRLGLDKRADTDEARTPSTPMRFRRASLRRYHEAPSVHGDLLPILVPSLTRRVFEAVAGKTAFHKSWIQSDLDLLIVEETGTRIDVLSDEEQRNSNESDEKRWRKVRSALFYQSYKVRPRQTIDVPGGTLRVFETTEGFGASRALLLPDYDYDASREGGYLAVPTRDQIVIARPDDHSDAPLMLPELRALVADSIKHSNFGLSDALFQLEPGDVHNFEESTFQISYPGLCIEDLIGDISI